MHNENSGVSLFSKILHFCKSSDFNQGSQFKDMPFFLNSQSLWPVSDILQPSAT